MARRRFQLTEAQIMELTGAYVRCKDGPTRTRYQAVRLYGNGYPTQEVIAITGCSRTSLMDWCRQYREQGIDSLIDKRNGGNRAQLTSEQMDQLKERLQTYTPIQLFGAMAATIDGQYWSIEDLHRAVEQWYGVRYRSRSTYRRLFLACGFSYQRPAKVFKSRREAQLVEFEERLEKNWSTSLKKPLKP